MIRSTTDEMLAVRFDKEPWEDEAGRRFAVNPDPSGDGYLRYRPRPEFIPSRDPLPYFCEEGDHRCDARIVKATSGQGYATHPDAHRWEFAPRPEFARPEPNPILVAFRRVPVESRGDFIEGVLGEDGDWGHLLDARKVLTRLSALKAVA